MAGITTIQLSLKEKVILDTIKREIGAKNYSEVILWLAKKAKTLGKSEMGTLPKLHSFKREKHDRFD
ncbi:MAG TPA: hypothetical protein VND15_00895 [Candidatus Acidoferrales bacterium]|nr:hypothetical protein [Candidatus Acidoferrales bacterium]